ncbi:MAG: STAS domain-containing protein [Clostridiaceae bacterium]|nr:STAS domain-containing protein [Clostridiaceae bacterium]
MKIKHTMSEGILTVSPEGELDHHRAMETIGSISELIDLNLPPRVRLDFSHIPFMDSSGIAVVMRAFKGTRDIGSVFEIANVPQQPLKVLKAAGIDKIIPFR